MQKQEKQGIQTNKQTANKQQKECTNGRTSRTRQHLTLSLSLFLPSTNHLNLFRLIAHLRAAHLLKRRNPRRPLLVVHRQELPVPMRRIQLNAEPLLVRL